MASGSIGAQLDFDIKQGSDFILEVDLVDESDVPLDTSHYDAVATLRKKPFAVASTAITCTFPVPGRLRFFIAHAITAELACGAEIDDDASAYAWDCELVAKADGIITPAFFGDVRVFRNI